MSSRGSETKYWCWTMNNPQPFGYECPRDWNDVEYCVWQLEVGDSGTEHLQGYVVFKNRHRLTWLRSMLEKLGLPAGIIHWEPRRGNHDEAKAYCMKADNPIDGPWEIGSDANVPRNSGQRTDLESLKAEIESGVSMKEIASNNFANFLRYSRSIKEYRGMLTQPRDRNVPSTIHVFWGPPGTGKTRRALDMYPNAYMMPAPNAKNGPCWWLGYAGEYEVIFDDFYGWIKYDDMLRILDRGPYKVQDKGTSMELAAKKFVLTSNIHPRYWYKGVNDTSALMDRLENPLRNPEGGIYEMNMNWDVDFSVNENVEPGNDSDGSIDFDEL